MQNVFTVCRSAVAATSELGLPPVRPKNAEPSVKKRGPSAALRRHVSLSQGGSVNVASGRFHGLQIVVTGDGFGNSKSRCEKNETRSAYLSMLPIHIAMHSHANRGSIVLEHRKPSPISQVL